MLSHRLILGTILGVLVVLATWLDERLSAVAAPSWWPGPAPGETLPPGLVVAPAVIAVAMAATLELTRIHRLKHLGGAWWLNAVAAGVGLISLTFTGPASGVAVATAAVLVLFLAYGQTAWDRNPAGATASAGGALLAFVYLGLLPAFLILIRLDYSAWTLALTLLLVKSCDIGAYFSGRAFGRRKLIPWLSPGKTWEGLAGGIALAAAVGAAAGALAERAPVAAALRVEIEPLSGAMLGGFLGLVGQLGDLAASLLKRDAGVKDASRLLPGFGGVLDVLDSPLIAAPAAWWAFRLIQAG